MTYLLVNHEGVNTVTLVQQWKSNLFVFSLNLNTNTNCAMKFAQDKFKPINEISQQTILKRYQKMLAYPRILLLDLKIQITPVGVKGINDEDLLKLVEFFPSMLETNIINIEKLF